MAKRDEVDWYGLLSNAKLSYTDIARMTGRSLSTCEGWARRLKLLWVRSKRTGPNQRYEGALKNRIVEAIRAGKASRAIARELGVPESSVRYLRKKTAT